MQRMSSLGGATVSHIIPKLRRKRLPSYAIRNRKGDSLGVSLHEAPQKAECTQWRVRH